MQTVSLVKKIIFNLYFCLVFIFITLVGLAVLPVILLVNLLLFSRTIGSGLRRAIRFYGWVLVCLVPFRAPVKVEYRGDMLPDAVIFVANHNSAIDPYLFGAIATENGFVTSWPFKIPLYALFMRLAEYVNSEDGWDEMSRQCRDLLGAGSSITIWPEGHRSRDGRLGRFKNGAFALAVQTGYPIVPVCILGSGIVFPPGSKLLTPGIVKLIVLDPVYPENEGETQEIAVKELRVRVHCTMEKTLAENGHFQQRKRENEGSLHKKLWI